MSMSIDPVIERLSVLKQQLREAKGEDVRRITGVDLYTLTDSRIQGAWKRRIQYYETLSHDDAFLQLEDSACDAAQRLARVALAIAQKLSPEWASRFSDWLWPIADLPWEDENTLEEKLQHYLKSENYCSIRQLTEGNLGSYPMSEGIYYNCNRILEQHVLLYQHCQRFGKASHQLGTKEEQTEYDQEFRNLSNLINDLELQLVQEPRKLHLKNFEVVQIAASAFDHTILGPWMKGIESCRGENEDRKTEKIRKAAIDVCEVLAFEIATNSPAAVPLIQQQEPLEKLGLKIWPSRQEVECAEKKFPLTGKSWSIVEKCIANQGWVTECGSRGKIDIDSDVRDLNAPWKNTGYRIAKHRGNKIILGISTRNRSHKKTAETPTKILRKSSVAVT